MKSKETLFETLEKEVKSLLKQQTALRIKLNEIEERKQLLEVQVKVLLKDNQMLKDETERLKISQALGGDVAHRKLMKIRLNGLIKEIDQCIRLVNYRD